MGRTEKTIKEQWAYMVAKLVHYVLTDEEFSEDDVEFLEKYGTYFAGKLGWEGEVIDKHDILNIKVLLVSIFTAHADDVMEDGEVTRPEVMEIGNIFADSLESYFSGEKMEIITFIQRRT